MVKAQQTTHAQARRFRATREQHSQEAAEDYTELIYDLIARQGEARIGEIAHHLGISHVTAIRTVRRLQEEGYVETARQRPVLLTGKGRKLALFAKERHRVLVEFLVSLGVPAKVAETDAEGAEHHISAITLQKISEFLKRV